MKNLRPVVICCTLILALVGTACSPTPTATLIPPTATTVVATTAPTTGTTATAAATTAATTAAATAASTEAATMAATSAATAAPTMAATTIVVNAGGELVVGYVLVGPKEDKGWSEAQYRASQYVEKNVPGVKSVIVDKVNPADQPNITLQQIVDNMKAEGVKLIFTTSDAFQVDTLAVAKKTPDITFI